MKNIIKIKEQIPPLNDPNGVLAVSDIDKANLFGNHLSKIFTPRPNINPDLEHLNTIKNYLFK